MTAKKVCPNFSSDKTEPNFYNRLILVGLHHRTFPYSLNCLTELHSSFFWVEVNLTFVVRFCCLQLNSKKLPEKITRPTD
jgi:hypothetical protein